MKYVAATLACALALTAASVGITHAATVTNGAQQDPMSSLVAAIAKKFNVSTTDVQSVFDAQRTQMETARQQEATDRITQAVTDGKLTQAQATTLTAKLKEFETFHASLKGKTKEECKAAMDTYMASLKQWAADNNIPTDYLPLGGPGMGGPGGRGPGGQGGPGMNGQGGRGQGPNQNSQGVQNGATNAPPVAR